MDDPSSFDALFLTLARLQQRGGLRVDTGGATDWYEVMLFPPATDREIAAAVASVGRKLPEEFLRFWRFSDGANLFVNDSGLHGVGVASTDRIAELQREEEEVYGREALEPYVVFARANGSGDFLVFELETGRVLDGVHAEQPAEWRPIAGGFRDWLSRFTEKGGRYYWLEDLYERAR